jgi:asparagine N-glycosylation enzyme membrane subunit Stt3
MYLIALYVFFIVCAFVFLLIIGEYIGFRSKRLALVHLIGALILFVVSAFIFNVQYKSGDSYAVFAWLTIIWLFNTLMRGLIWENWESIEQDRIKRRERRKK